MRDVVLLPPLPPGALQVLDALLLRGRRLHIALLQTPAGTRQPRFSVSERPPTPPLKAEQNAFETLQMFHICQCWCPVEPPSIVQVFYMQLEMFGVGPHVAILPVNGTILELHSSLRVGFLNIFAHL